ncbi:MAG: DUF3179 domain-containing (seleno)protein, partial [Acidobacteriota bacterium]|nr:DUF3179 domain-containing (seleno)protein [Acidobacteriota bacterium]
PVTGKLVGSELKLKRLPIVTTTWSAWRKSHPRTKVLSLETGHRRDYGEGVAYRAYFATQELMFPVRFRDSRLSNKQEVVALLLEGEAVAYDTDFLRENPLHHDRVGSQSIVILTDRSGANRVYDATGVTFTRWNREARLTDSHRQSWTVGEEALTNQAGEKRLRLPAHRAFWFGWHNQFPNSRLVR